MRNKVKFVSTFIRCLASRPVVAEGCGHLTREFSVAYKGDDWVVVQVPPDNDRAYCAKCVAKSAIICAWCGQIIWPGDPISLSAPLSAKFFKKLEGAVCFDRETMTMVGCLRPECGSRFDMAGFWAVPGRVLLLT